MPGLEILTNAQMRAADAAAIAEGTAGFTLMTRAGAAVAQAVMDRWPNGPVAVLCGPGANGGDGLVAAAALRAAGRTVRLAAMTSLSAMKGDAALAAEAWSGPVERLSAAVFSGAAVIVDALFGAGLDRPLESGVQTLLRAAAASPALGRCPLWLAHYGDAAPEAPAPWRRWTLWQYTDGAQGPGPHRVPGIGACDRSRFEGTESELRSAWPFGV